MDRDGAARIKEGRGMVSATGQHTADTAGGGFLHKLNTVWHERALQVFMVIVLLHWMEHLVQAFQVFVLGWARPDSRGVLGQLFPWLVTSEWLHYGYAIVMLIGLAILLPGFHGRSRHWWTAALAIQIWHHFEHLLLQGQALAGMNMFGAKVPTSIVQLWVPRVELHLFYNAIVFIPMVIAMYYHMYPPQSERGTPATCSCRKVDTTAA
jgi:hypothetical protein